MSGALMHEQGNGQGFIARMIEAPAATSGLAGVALIVIGLGLSWAINYAAGGAGDFPPHLFYVPIVFAAARFGLLGAIATAVAAGIIAGPLLPLDTAMGTGQHLSDWLARSAFFLGIGFIMALLIHRLQTALERERRVAQEEHELAVQKTTLIHTVSHEFRTPLTVIEGVAKTLVNLNLVAEEGRPLLEGLERATAWLDELVMGLLAAGGALGEPDAGDRPMSLETVCREIAQSIGGDTTSRRLRTELDPEAAWIGHHQGELRFVLRTVIDNALKFSPEGSPVEIRSRRLGDRLEVRVGDQGPGVAPGFLERAFEAFTQQDVSTIREKGGLGIGLFVARNMVQRLGGGIELEPRAGGGTEVILSIPANGVARSE